MFWKGEKIESPGAGLRGSKDASLDPSWKGKAVKLEVGW